MSATGRGAEREVDDFYGTPAWCVRRLMEAVRFPLFVPMFEPAVGDGAICRAVDSALACSNWTTNDIVDRGYPLTYQQDYLKASFRDGGIMKYREFAITNPPFRHAEAFARQMMLHCRESWLLLRLNFLEGDKRRDWLENEAKPDVYVLPNRPVFCRNAKGKFGTDGTAYAWMKFPGEKRYHILGRTSRQERREHIDCLVAKEEARKAA